MAQYTTGGATVVSGSSIVSGTGTAWLANVKTGDCFMFQGEQAVYNVNTVNGDGLLQISPPYAGSDRVNAPYAIVRDFTSLLGLPEISGKDTGWPFLLTQALRKIDSFLQLLKEGTDAEFQSLKEGQTAQVISRMTLAELQAELGYPDKTPGRVTNDPAPANNGDYTKSGASGTGSWVPSSYDRVTLLQSGPVADVSDKVGGGRVRSDQIYGNPVVSGSAAAPGTVWSDFTPFRYGGLLTKVEAYVTGAGSGSGRFLLLSPAGSSWTVKAVIPVSGLSAGAKTFSAGSDFAAVSVDAGMVLAWHAAAGGASLAYTAGTGNSLQGTYAAVAQGDTLNLTAGTILFSLRATVSTMAGIVESRLGVVENAAATVKGALQRNLAPSVAVGSTASDVADGTFTKIYASDPAAGDGYLADFRGRFSRAGSGEVHVLIPTGTGGYLVTGVYPVWVAAGEGSLVSQIPTPMWLPKGARLAYRPITGVAPRYAGSGSTYSVAGDTGLGSSVTLSFENISAALSLSVAPLSRSSAFLENQRFVGSASADWTLNGWTWGPSGLSGPSSPGWGKSAYLNRFTSAAKRGVRARFTLANQSAKFGLSYDPSTNVVYGSAAVVDGAASLLQLYHLNGAGVAVKSKEVSIPWSLPSVVELQWDRSGMSQTVTLFDPAGQRTVTLSQAMGDSGVVDNAAFNYGRPGVIQVSGTGVVCTRFQFSRRAPRKLQAIVFGDSIAMGNANGASWASNWPYLLDTARGKNDVLNCSIGGGTSGELATRLGVALGSIPGDVDLSPYEPAYVVIALGVNDGTQAAWRANLAAIINAVLARGAVPVLATVTPFAAKQTLINAMNADIMGGYFGRYDYLDFAAAVTVGNDRVTPDTSLYVESSNYLHPNSAGQARMYQQLKIDAPWLLADPAE